MRSIEPLFIAKCLRLYRRSYDDCGVKFKDYNIRMSHEGLEVHSD